LKEVIHLSTPLESRKATDKKRKKPLLDRIWQFFASVRVAIVIISLIAVLSVIGTVVPQENAIPSSDPERYYTSVYGTWGRIMYSLGFTNMYVSWWFLALLLLLATSLIICSWERIVPLYKSLKYQVIRKSVQWIRQQKWYMAVPEAAVTANGDAAAFDRLKQALAKKRYVIREDGDAFLAEKGRFARFGPYILHIGLLIIIAGAFSRTLPGWYFNTSVLIREGETKPIPDTDFAVRNDKFTIQFYDDGRPKMYQTLATIVKNNQDIKTASIEVNHAMKFEHVSLFQQSFGDPTFKTATITFSKPDSDKPLGSFQMNFEHPDTQYKVGDYTIQVLNYFPDFKMQNNQPATESSEARKPVFIFQVKGPGIQTPRPQVFFAFFPILSKLQKDSPVQFMIQDIVKTQATVLRVHKDLGIPIVYGGTGVVMFGLILTFYFQHRRVWVRIEDEVLHMGAHTNKNWYGLKKELEKVLSEAHLSSRGHGEEGGNPLVTNK
jgi:cytochrome c biogenesis protein